ncbi:MAG: HisA/HisF-related TIM barrel protein, partial [Actinomycetota bacterium]
MRLEQGDFTRERVYGDDPLQVARQFADAGATWVHIVDLDAAKGDDNNREVVSRIASALGASVQIQTGGGVRSL